MTYGNRAMTALEKSLPTTQQQSAGVQTSCRLGAALMALAHGTSNQENAAILTFMALSLQASDDRLLFTVDTDKEGQKIRLELREGVLRAFALGLNLGAQRMLQESGGRSLYSPCANSLIAPRLPVVRDAGPDKALRLPVDAHRLPGRTRSAIAVRDGFAKPNLDHLPAEAVARKFGQQLVAIARHPAKRLQHAAAEKLIAGHRSAVRGAVAGRASRSRHARTRWPHASSSTPPAPAGQASTAS